MTGLVATLQAGEPEVRKRGMLAIAGVQTERRPGLGSPRSGPYRLGAFLADAKLTNGVRRIAARIKLVGRIVDGRLFVLHA